jgi:hypothetical protein
MAMWSRTVAPSPIDVVPDRGPAADDHARREVAERADSRDVLDDHAGVTITCDPTTAPAFDRAASTTAPTSPGAGRDRRRGG